MTATLSYRPITIEDMDFLYRLYISTRAEEMSHVPWDDQQKAVLLRQQFDAQHHQYRENYPNADFLVLVVDGKDAGRLYVAYDPDEVRVIDISLLSEFRGRGIGGSVLRGVLDKAGDRRVILHVLSSNPAIRLYKRLGFEVVEVVEPYLRMQWTARSARDRSQTRR